MKSSLDNINNVLDNNKVLYIPVFQRPYIWDKKQCKRLWNDLMLLYNDIKKKHFLGSLVVVQDLSNGAWESNNLIIIDGLQRLTTIILLLIAIRDVLEKDLSDFNYLTRINSSGDKIHKIVLNGDDKHILFDLLERNKQGLKDKKSKLIDNLNYFVELLKNNNINFNKLKEAFSKLEIVTMTVEENDDNPQEIFETINSTGAPLIKSDLIRNNLLFSEDKKTQENLYLNYWVKIENLFTKDKEEYINLFFKDFLTLQLNRIPKNNDIYEEFKNWRLHSEFQKDTERLLKIIYDNAILYTNFLYAREKDKEINEFFKDFLEINNTPVFPALLKFMIDYESQKINKNELLEILEICISFLIRRKICSIPVSSLNKIFFDLIKNIEFNNYVTSVKTFIVSGINSSEFPKDEKFKEFFITKNFKQNDKVHFILKKIEMHLNKKANVNFSTYTIEHILPKNQNLNNDWVQSLGPNWKDIQINNLNKIGNLTLTPYNSEMSDKFFTQKKTMQNGFDKSGLRINDYLLDKNIWTEKEIKERTEILLQNALKIWKYPRLSNEEKTKRDNIKLNQEKYDLHSYKITETNLKLFEIIDQYMLSLNHNISKVFNKWYISYNVSNNTNKRSLIYIVLRSNYISILFNTPFGQIIDKNGLCEDVSNIGKWGSGDVRIHFENLSDKEYIFDLINQTIKYNLNKINKKN
ncbi:DUF262 domain-containing protein [Mycoplasma leonicaptivi]|uniref:DUF262 domain-containing protein n=1 Tax=Mycoplasma leonicaptivi TaxID=36742 RepID=UPI000483B3AC|nr:DUF262 domain-containing protein [Mycoplasma leonicaptivi]